MIGKLEPEFAFLAFFLKKQIRMSVRDRFGGGGASREKEEITTRQND